MPELGKATYVVDIESHKYEEGMRRVRTQTKKDAIENEKDLNKMAGDWDQMTVGIRRANVAEEEHVKTTKKVEKEHDNLGKRVVHLNQAFSLFGKTLGLLKWPAFLAAGGAAAQGINVLLGGAVALTGALGPLTGALASAASGYLALGQAALTIKLAGIKDISAALSGNAAALKRLSPEAQKFTETLKGMKPVLDGLRKTVQSRLFPGLTDGLKEAAKNAPVLNKVLALTADTMAGLARNAGALLGSKGFGKLFASVGAGNARTIQQLGNAFLHLVPAFLHVVDAAKPLTNWLGQAADHGARFLNVAAKAGEKTGKLGDFFQSTQHALKQWGSILSDLGVTLFNVFKAGAPLGHEIVNIFQKGSEHLRQWSESTSGRNGLAQFFKDIRAPLFETGRLFRDLVTTILGVGGGGKSGPLFQLLHSLRVDVLPVLAQVAMQTLQSFGPALVGAISSVAKLFGDLGGAAGPLTLFVKGIGKAADVLHDLLNSSGGLKSFVVTLLSAGAVLSALGIASFTSKLFGMKAGWNAVGNAAKFARNQIGGVAAVETEAQAAGAVPVGGRLPRGKRAAGAAKKGFTQFGQSLGLGATAGAAAEAPEFIAEGMGGGAAGVGAETGAGSLGMGGTIATGGILLGILAAIAAAAVAIKTNFLGVKDVLGKIFAPLIDQVTTLVKRITGAGSLGEGLSDIYKAIKPLAVIAFKLVGIFVTLGTVMFIAPFITALTVVFWSLNKAIDAVTWTIHAAVDAWNWLKKAATDVAGVISTVVTDAFGMFSKVVSRFVGTWIQHFTDLGNFLWDKIGAPIWNKIRGPINGFLNFVKGLFGGGGKIRSMIGDAASFLWNKIGAPLWNKVKGPIGDIGDFFAKVFRRVKNIIGDVTDWIRNKFGDLVGFFSNIGDKIGNAFNKVGNKISGAFSDAWDAVSNFVGDIAGVVDDVMSFLGLGKPLASLENGGGKSVNPKGAEQKGHGAHGRSAPKKKQRGGPIPGMQEGDVVPAMLEPGEYVLNKKAVRALGLSTLDFVNSQYPRFQTGGAVSHFLSGADVGSAIGSAAGSAASQIAPGAGAVVSAGKQIAGGGGPAGKFLGALPDALGGWLHPIATKILSAARSWIGHKVASAVTSIFGGGHSGVGNYMGIPMANWVISSLGFAASKGVKPQPTSGYRPPGQVIHGPVVAPQGHSEHQGTVFPHGAVDFGGPFDAAAKVKKMAVVGATRNFSMPLLAPIGFTDDGHASGTGHQKGGLIRGYQGGGIVGDFARAVIDTKAPKRAGLALFEAGYAESGMRDLSYGDSSSTGTLQLLASTAHGMGLNPHDEYAVAKAFLTRGYYKYGSAIRNAAAGYSPANIATRVQGNATGAGVYSAQFNNAKRGIAAAGLKWNHKDKPMWVGSGDDAKTNTGVPAPGIKQTTADLKNQLRAHKDSFKKKKDAVDFLVGLGVKQTRAQAIVDHWWPNRNRVLPDNTDSGGADLGQDPGTGDDGSLAAAQALAALEAGQILGLQQQLAVSQAQYPVFRDIFGPLGFGPFIPTSPTAADIQSPVPYAPFATPPPHVYVPGGEGDTIMGGKLPKKKHPHKGKGLFVNHPHGIKKLKKHHDGGTVEGPWGEDVLTIAKGGERFVKPGGDGVGAGGSNVEVAVHGDLITERSLEDAIEVKVGGVLRKSVSKQRRRAGG